MLSAVTNKQTNHLSSVNVPHKVVYVWTEWVVATCLNVARESAQSHHFTSHLIWGTCRQLFYECINNLQCPLIGGNNLITALAMARFRKLRSGSYRTRNVVLHVIMCLKCCALIVVWGLLMSVLGSYFVVRRRSSPLVVCLNSDAVEPSNLVYRGN